MKFKKRKKIVAGAAVLLTSVGAFAGVSGAICKPSHPHTGTHSPYGDPQISCHLPTPGSGVTIIGGGCKKVG